MPLIQDTNTSSERLKPRLRTILFSALRVAAAAVAGLILLVLLALLLLQAPFVAGPVARIVLSLANPWEGTEATVSSAGGTWLTGLSLREVRISSPDGSLVIAIDSLGATYDLAALTRGELRFETVRLVRPVVVTGYTPEGEMEFLRPFSSPPDAEPDTSEGLRVFGGSVSVSLGGFFLHAEEDPSATTADISNVLLGARNVSIGRTISFSLDTLSTEYRPRPDARESMQICLAGEMAADLITVRTLKVLGGRTDIQGSGTIALPFDTLFTPVTTSFRLDARPIAYRDLHPFFADFGPEGEASVAVTLTRDRGRAYASAIGTFADGGSFEANVAAEVHAAGDPSLRAEVKTSNVSIAAFTGKADTTQHISVLGRLSGRGSSPSSFTGSLKAELDALGLAGPRRLHASVDADLDRGDAQIRASGALDSLRFTLDGLLRPFSEPPTYDLTVAGQIPLIGGGTESDDLLRRLEGLSARVHATGAGFNPLAGSSRVVVDAKWAGNPHIQSLELEASSRDSAAEASGQITTTEGYLRLAARARFGVAGEVVLRSAEFSSLDLSALLGLQKAASLTGSAVGHVRGSDLASMEGSFSLQLDSSRVGTTRIARGKLDVRSHRGVVTATVDGETSDGIIRVQATAEPFAEQITVLVREANFTGLDLGGLFLGEDGATDLNGSARLRLVMAPTSGTAAGTAEAASGRRPDLVGTIEVDIGRSRIYRQEILGAAVDGELTGQVVALELDLRTPEGGALLSGSVEPFREFPEMQLADGRIEHIDLGALAGINGLDTDISGTLSAGLRGSSWETASGAMVLTLLPSRINREPVNEARVAVDLDRGFASLRAYASLLSGSLSTVASGTYLEDRLSFNTEADVDIRDLSLLARDTSLAGSGARISFEAEGIWGAPDSTRMSGRVVARGRLDSLQVDSLVAVLSVLGRTIEVDSLLLRSNTGVIRGAGTIAVFDTTGKSQSDFALTGSLASLHRLRGITGLRLSSSGTAEISARLTGTGRAGELSASTEMANLDVEEVLIAGLRARGSARLGTGGVVEDMHAEVTARDVAIGEFMIDDFAAGATTDGRVSSFRTSVTLEDGEWIAVAGTGEELGDRFGITLDSLTVNLDDRLWVLEERAHLVIGRGITVDGLSAVSGPRRISVHGVLDPEGEQDFVFQIDSLAFDRIARLLGRPGLGGELTFSGLVTGPARKPRATGRLGATILSGDTLLGTIESEVDWTDGLMKVISTVTQPDQSKLKAVFSLPATLPIVSSTAAGTPSAGRVISTPREFALQTNGFDLGFLEPLIGSDAVTGLRGTLTADVVLREQAGGFFGSGHLGIDTGYVRANSIGVEYSDIRLRASLEGPGFTIDTLSVRTGEGGMGASGTVSLASPENPAFDLLFRQHKFVGINTQTLRAVADGSVSVSGTLRRPVITGDITIDESNFVVPENVGEGEVESVELTDADYAVLRERFGYRRPAPGTSAADDTTRVSLDVALHFPRRSWIRKKANPSLSVELEGDLKVRSRPAEAMSLVGTLKPVPGRSYVSQFGRQFEIKSGEIRFDGPPEQFNMNVDSEYRVPARSGSGMSEATIRMRVERRLERFVFSLSSDPPMEQADILSYLTTGTATTGAFASTSSQGNLATSAALEQVVGAIGGLAEDKIPLDIFQIRQDGSRSITIVAGNYITPQTYIGVRYPILLQQTGQDSYYDTGTEFEVEYQAVPWLFLNAKGGSSRLLLLLKSRYAY